MNVPARGRADLENGALPEKSGEQGWANICARWLRGRFGSYVIAFAGFAISAGFYGLVLHLGIATHTPLWRILSATLLLLYLLVLIGSAWLGYGSGVLICLLYSLALPVLFPRHGTVAAFDGVRSLLLFCISLLVSYLAASQRRREAELVRAAAELERRVEAGTIEAVRSAERTVRALEEAKEQAQLLDLAHDAILSMDWNGAIRFWNHGAEEMYGYTRAEALGRISHDLLRTVAPAPIPQILEELTRKGHWEGELVHTRKDGASLTIASRWAARHDAAGKPVGFLEINTDVTQQRRLEEQFRHTQKLESLGVLAGGVAHDFNNLLTGILGNASLALKFAGVGPARGMLEDIVKASERAADLTRQLLAYAGKGRFVLRTIDLSELVREIGALLQTSFPKHAQLRMQLAEGLPGVEADPGQVQQIVMNLVLNGAEAIGNERGSVLVTTGVQDMDAAAVRTLSAAGYAIEQRRYVTLEVRDTGAGMTEETLARIFDPFFTTKFAGRGLGLSAVQGIVRAHGGALEVCSQPGEGSKFRVFFPASESRPALPAAAPVRDLAGAGTVLVVDDEDFVRQIARHALEHYGYGVMVASDGVEAVELFRESLGHIDLVLLDMTMPGMGGEETLRRLHEIDPAVRVLLTSGYSETEATERFSAHGLAGFIQKPFTAAALAEKTKAALEITGHEVRGATR